MTTAKDIMHAGAAWIPDGVMLDRAAELMRELGVGALPVSDDHERLCGILTDRDIVVGCVALGRDPSRVTAGELTRGTPRWIDADAGVDRVLREMIDHRVRRLPVMEGERMVGMISEADLARHLSGEEVGEWAARIYAGSDD
ncbi:CBS domain-containing protein [Streptantibioticus silvisoli]|jgi:CBS domain-containing protein|uniref:CBS domain-containing protein n=1 Tax=Streptantibioticus silvisoli TaxID=2705255 RepID=A0ABT6W3Q0_9ACTN|nr:CBS domain-containing protein [Streptantibioticus silvisoli]MDI5965368.1 CBS domain-containing protein [Streptantibioticus silvisoli]